MEFIIKTLKLILYNKLNITIFKILIIIVIFNRKK